MPDMNDLVERQANGVIFCSVPQIFAKVNRVRRRVLINSTIRVAGPQNPGERIVQVQVNEHTIRAHQQMHADQGQGPGQCLSARSAMSGVPFLGVEQGSRHPVGGNEAKPRGHFGAALALGALGLQPLLFDTPQSPQFRRSFGCILILNFPRIAVMTD